MPVKSSRLGALEQTSLMCERDCYFFCSFLFVGEKREIFYVIETFLELFLGCFLLYVL